MVDCMVQSRPHQMVRSTSHRVATPTTSSYPRTMASHGLSARWEQTSLRQIREEFRGFHRYESNAYHVWTGADEGVYMSRSTDSGETWEQESIRISHTGVISTVFLKPMQAMPGHGHHYLGSEDTEMLNQSDIDGNPWDGNAHYAPNNATYHLYITYSLNALDENPTFHTYRVTEDPVQEGIDLSEFGRLSRYRWFKPKSTGLQRPSYRSKDVSTLHLQMVARRLRNESEHDGFRFRDGRGAVYYLASGPSLYMQMVKCNHSNIDAFKQHGFTLHIQF